MILTLKDGNVEINPGPKKKVLKIFSCCRWNVSSALHIKKLFLLAAFNAIHQYYVLCLSEINISNIISLQGCNLLRSDNTDNVRRCRVCMYCKENLSLKRINIPHIFWCVVCEVTMQRHKGYIVVISRSPSQ